MGPNHRHLHPHAPSCPLSRSSLCPPWPFCHGHVPPPVHPLIHGLCALNPRLHSLTCPYSRCPIPGFFSPVPANPRPGFVLHRPDDQKALAPQAKETSGWISLSPEETTEMIEDEEEPVFVLTDEWMEFFAKSEAKRRSERKQKQRSSKKLV